MYETIIISNHNINLLPDNERAADQSSIEQLP